MNFPGFGFVSKLFNMARGTNGVLQQLKSIQTAREKWLEMNLTEKRKAYRCGKDFVVLEDVPTWPEYANKHLQSKKRKYYV